MVRLAEKLVERMRAELREVGIYEEWLHFREMVLLIFKALPKFIYDYTRGSLIWANSFNIEEKGY